VTGNVPGGAPTVLRMMLGKQLQALRERAGLSYEKAAEAIYSSPWTVRRMERAEGGLKPLAVKGLLVAYGITDVREIDAFLSLSKEASRPGWWHSYNDVLPGWFRTFVGLEEAASYIRGYDPHWIPGLLQTGDYARASVRVGFPDAADDESGRRVALRLARQQILDRPMPPRLWLVIDENVLRRPAATTGAAVMRAQIDRLIEAAQQPNITLQILPFSAGLHPAMYGPFRIFRFEAAELPDIVYGETMTSAYYIDKPDEAVEYVKALDRICAQAAPAADTVPILRTIRKEI
jgi:transcriptional regulator with XRE-family HTH domain